ncbi:HEPN domain-containing protein [Paenibacillus elgii]|uniref:HEPN domain-containing protein n=1 Tax=Paenibacillus elgii TaxID=189691 RepID=UPI000FDAE0F7|nr:HEPN domain-containing protein [Paenibacillus elgii]NEN80800.1 hypothetical protein [Paenibacillus elgii]
MKEYFFTVLMIKPPDGIDEYRNGDYGFIRRKWEVSIFDLATLQNNHALGVSYELISIFLNTCNMEFSVKANSKDEAVYVFKLLRALLYINGFTPFITPLLSTYSINQYAGINFRDSDSLREKLPLELREGIKSGGNDIVQISPMELSFQIIHTENNSITKEIFDKSIAQMTALKRLIENTPHIGNVIDSFINIPFIHNYNQSILFIWTIIESLFPKVNSEVSFRLSIYITQLLYDENKLERFQKIKKLYDLRSKIAHGSKTTSNFVEWLDCWTLLLEICESFIRRGELPNEDKLFSELFVK